MKCPKCNHIMLMEEDITIGKHIKDYWCEKCQYSIVWRDGEIIDEYYSD